MENAQMRHEAAPLDAMDHKSYFLSVIGQRLLLVVLLVLSISRTVSGQASRIDEIVVYLVPALFLINTLGIRQPKRIVVTTTGIAFEGIRGRHEYRWSDLGILKVTEFIMTDRIYLRIGRQRVFSGRYWIDSGKYPGFEDVLAGLKKKEIELHPARARYQKKKR